MQENQLFAVPLTSAVVFPKTSRGDVECLLEDEKLIVRWNNNSVVTVVSNMRRNTQTLTLKDGTKQKCASDVVKQPTCIKNFNSHMGGVDPHNQCVNRYRISIQSKMWWWPCWALNTVMVNSWCYYRYMKLFAKNRCNAVERELMSTDFTSNHENKTYSIIIHFSILVD